MGLIWRQLPTLLPQAAQQSTIQQHDWDHIFQSGSDSEPSPCQAGHEAPAAITAQAARGRIMIVQTFTTGNQGGAEISSKMCNISNSHGRARKAHFGNLRSQGYETGLAKGVPSVRSGQLGTSESAVSPVSRRLFQKNVKSRWKVCTFYRFTRNLLFIESSMFL